MSSVARHRVPARSAVLAICTLVGLLGAACTPTNPGGGGSTTSQFCQFWDKVQDEDTAPTDTNAVLVKQEVVALAEDTTVVGSECTDAGAKVELDGATLAEGEEVASEIGGDDSKKTAAVTGPEIAADKVVLENLSVRALSVEIGTFGIRLTGNVSVRLSGVTSTIGFVGTLTNLDNWSVTLSSTMFNIPGITTTPATFSGTLAVKNGVPSLALTAAVTSAKVGDVTVNNATLKLDATQVSTKASVTGNLKIGPSTASGVVNVEFDRAGSIVAAHAEIAAHLVGTQVGNKQVDFTGTVTLDGNQHETVASFSGSGILGDMVVNEASGSLTLATNKATFNGKLDVQQGANSVRFNGTIIWDGITAQVPYLMAEGDGEFSGVLPDGQTVSVAGSMSIEVINGQARAVVTGNFQVGTLKANGSAVVETSGGTTSLEVDADLVGAGFNASLEGGIVITDGYAETVQLDATISGAVQIGDVTLTGATLSVRSQLGQPLSLSFAGGLTIGTRANVIGSFDATFGPNGTLLTLGGSASGSLALSSWAVVPFSGSIVATSEQVTLTGSGSVTFTNFPAGIDFSGSLTSSLTVPTWTLNGTGAFHLGPINVLNARLSLSHVAGMKATRLGFYFAIIGIPTYFEGDFYMKPSGGCDHVDITSGNFITRGLLALVLPGAIGCAVNV